MSLVTQRQDMVVAHDLARALVKPRKKEAAQTKLRYRWDRLWLTHWFRAMLLFWLPALAVVLALYGGWRSPTVSGWVVAQVQAMRDGLAARPELTITEVQIPFGSEDLQQQVRGVMALELPVSVMDADLAGLRRMVEGLSAVESASVRYESGVLQVAIVERVPAIVWRNLSRIYLLDETGVRVAEVARRMVRPDLPLVVGMGADKALLEAREIFDIASPLGSRVLGLVRMGERRWDVVLKDVMIMLPAMGGPDAMRRVMALDASEGLLNVDASIIDLRDEDRTFVRISDAAWAKLLSVQAQVNGEGV